MVTYLRKLHPSKSNDKSLIIQRISQTPTVQYGSYPMDDSGPEVDPADEVEVIRRVGLAF